MVRVWVLIALAAAACGGADRGYVECVDDTSCDRFDDGRCLENDLTGHRFCAYPDGACSSGMRWSDLNVEDSVSGACVGALDASVPDALIDATPVDAPQGSWSTPPIRLPFGYDDYNFRGPAISDDGHEAFFFGPRADKIGIDNLWTATRESVDTDTWSVAAYVENVNGAEAAEQYPYVSASGLELFYSRDNVLLVSKRATTSTPFQGPSLAGFSGTEPVLSEEDLVVYYFDSAASCPSNTCRYKRTRSNTSSPWSDATLVQFPGAYEHVQVSRDGHRVLLSGVTSGAPVAIASRPSVDGNWSTAEPIPEFATMTAIKIARWGYHETEMYLVMPYLIPVDDPDEIYVSRLIP